MKDGYESWKRAYGEFSWERYLESIAKVNYTGTWVLEVARNELQPIKV
jgi:hypothetical protein